MVIGAFCVPGEAGFSTVSGSQLMTEGVWGEARRLVMLIGDRRLRHVTRSVAGTVSFPGTCAAADDEERAVACATHLLLLGLAKAYELPSTIVAACSDCGTWDGCARISALRQITFDSYGPANVGNCVTSLKYALEMVSNVGLSCAVYLRGEYDLLLKESANWALIRGVAETSTLMCAVCVERQEWVRELVEVPAMLRFVRHALCGIQSQRADPLTSRICARASLTMRLVGEQGPEVVRGDVARHFGAMGVILESFLTEFSLSRRRENARALLSMIRVLGEVSVSASGEPFFAKGRQTTLVAHCTAVSPRTLLLRLGRRGGLSLRLVALLGGKSCATLGEACGALNMEEVGSARAIADQGADEFKGLVTGDAVVVSSRATPAAPDRVVFIGDRVPADGPLCEAECVIGRVELRTPEAYCVALRERAELRTRLAAAAENRRRAARMGKELEALEAQIAAREAEIARARDLATMRANGVRLQQKDAAWLKQLEEGVVAIPLLVLLGRTGSAHCVRVCDRESLAASRAVSRRFVCKGHALKREHGCFPKKAAAPRGAELSGPEAVRSCPSSAARRLRSASVAGAVEGAPKGRLALRSHAHPDPP